MRLATDLALRDMADEPLQVACIVLLIAGMLAPLLLLLSIKQGVMDTLIGELRDDPAMRRLAVVGHHDHPPGTLERIRGWPETGFAVPQARSLARQLEVRRQDGSRFVSATLVPSGAGEPLLRAAAPAQPEDAVAVSAGMAQRLDLAEGNRIEIVARRGSPVTDRLLSAFEVGRVLPPGRLDGTTMLMHHRVVELIEMFYDGYAVPELGVEAGAPRSGAADRFESFRVYARDIADVAALELRLERALGTEVRSESAQIATFLDLERNLGRALTLIVAAALAGLAAALVALFWSAVIRKRRLLSMLSLMGLERRSLALFPIVQAGFYALGGALLALVLAGLAAWPITVMFATPLGGHVVGFPFGRIAALLAALVLVSLAASLVAARLAARSEPALVLRDTEA